MSGQIRLFRNDFNKLAQKHSDEYVFITNNTPEPKYITYERLSVIIDKHLNFFESKHLSPGDSIVSVMPNSVEALCCFLATVKGGYGFAPLACNVPSAEFKRWLEIVKPRLIMLTTLIDEELKAVAGESGIATVYIETDGEFVWLPRSSGNVSLGDCPRLYISTSGSTGEPKAVVIDSNRLWSSGYSFMQFHQLLDSALRFWNYLPMSYLGGLFNLGMIPLCVGGCTVVDEGFSGKTFLRFWQTIERYEVNTLWVVPTIVRGLVSIAEKTHRNVMGAQRCNIKRCFLGTAAIDLEIKQKFENLFGVYALENFALSETTFFTSETAATIQDRVDGSVGEVLPYAELKFVPADAEDDLQKSEIYVRSPFLFLGYLDLNGQIALVVDDDGFFATGDLGRLNENNTLVVSGRRREVIKKGGYLVSLREIEQVARRYEGVGDAAAVMIKHDFYGESYVLFIEPKHISFGENLVRCVNEYLHQCLVRYKWPESVKVLAELPRTASGKIRKHMLENAL